MANNNVHVTIESKGGGYYHVSETLAWSANALHWLVAKALPWSIGCFGTLALLQALGLLF